VLTIRLSRVGKKNHPQYRVVLQEKIKSPKGKVVDTLGYYHPLQKDFQCDIKKVEHYVQNGAKPSSTIARLLQKKGMKGMEQYIEKITIPVKKADQQEVSTEETVAA
jgi:small subunit ribosomal protein S16